MKIAIIAILVALALSVKVEAADRERSTYVGEGRYVGEGKSVDSAVLRQRNNEWTQHQSDRSEYQKSYERAERREREYERDNDYNYDGDVF